MASRFTFFTDQFEGTQAALAVMQPLFPGGPMPAFLGAGTVTDGKVTLPTLPPGRFALGVRDGETLLLRTGVVDFSSGSFEEDTGDFVSSYFLIRPDTTVITPAALGTLVPALPIVSRDASGTAVFRLTALTLTISGDLINATGAGTYLPTPIGGAVTFTYLFRLKPNPSIFNAARILEVETASATVKSADGSLLGFLINLVGDFLLWVMHEDVVSQIERAVQAAIDTSIQASLANAGAGAGVTGTAFSVTIDATAGISVDVFAAVNSLSVCPSGVTSGSIRLRPVAQIRALAAMRDRALRGTLRGDLYLEMFRKHRAELLHLALTHPELLKQADRAVEVGLRDFRPEAPAEGAMSEATAQEATRLLEMVAKVASPELAALARGLIPEVRAFVGQRVGDVLDRAGSAKGQQ